MVVRKNWCPNPKGKNDVTGWSFNNPPLDRVTGITGMPSHVSTAARYTGNGYVKTPTGDCIPDVVSTVSFYIRNNTGFEIFGGRQVFIGYTRSSGGDVFPTGHDFNTAALGPNGNIIRGSFTAPASPALTTGMYLIIDSLNGTFGTGFDISAVMYERVNAIDTYFDGDYPDCDWNGTDGNSTSTYNSAPPVSLGAFLPLL